MRRYCIMYYQQSYVLILSHEMALFPFTYHLNFNYVNDSLIILRSVRFQGPVLLIFRLRALNARFCPTFANASVYNHNPIRIYQYTNIASISCIFVTDWSIRWHDLAKPATIPFIRPKTLHVHTAPIKSLRYLLRHCPNVSYLTAKNQKLSACDFTIPHSCPFVPGRNWHRSPSCWPLPVPVVASRKQELYNFTVTPSITTAYHLQF